MKNLLPHLSAEFYKDFIDWSPHIMAAMLVMLAGWVLTKIGQGIIHRCSKNFSDDRKNLISLLTSITSITIWILTLITALASLGINVNALVASLGLSGFALSFAMKDTLANCLAGVLIVFYRPFCVGDQITVAGYTGKVTTIDLRYTTLKHDNSTMLIPNSIVFAKPVKLLH